MKEKLNTILNKVKEKGLQYMKFQTGLTNFIVYGFGVIWYLVMASLLIMPIVVFVKLIKFIF